MVKRKFEDRGYTLVSQEYIGKDIPLEYICKEHGLQRICYNSLRNGSGCPKCGRIRGDHKRKYSYDAVKDKFEASGFYLLSKDYINVKEKLKYQCIKCGHIGEITLDNVNQGCGCAKCARREGVEKRTLTFDFIKQEFLKVGLEVIDNKYTNSHSNIRYRCQICGRYGKMSYTHIQGGRGCGRCHSSYGEKTIELWLMKNKISYQTQYRIRGCRDKSELKFDFAITEGDSDDIIFLLEYNGIQHYTPVDFAGRGEEWAKDLFEKGRKRDEIKKRHCFDNGIPLVIIKYDQDIELELNKIFDKKEDLRNYSGVFVVS